MKSRNKMNTDDKNLKEISPVAARVPPFSEAFKFWLKLGFISFGGPAGQIAIMHRELVERKKWIDEASFLHALNFCMLLPGPEAQQLAAYNGWRLHGIKGGIAAGALFVLPSVFVLLALSYVYAKYGNVREINAVLEGLKPVVVAIVLEAVLKIGKRALKSWIHIIISAVSFAAIFAFHIPFPIIVLAAAIVGLASSKFQVSGFRFQISGLKPEVEGESRITNYELRNEQSKIRNPKSKILKTLAVFIVLWLIPLIMSGLIYGWRSLPVKVYLFFTQAAFVTFGGAYAVLAYVNQAMVDSYGWITAAQAIDGFALAETTPGPLIMVLQFIGFMAGWNAGNQTPLAVVCALLVTFATFLPSFLFIFMLAPYVEKLRGNEKLNQVLQGVTAAVVGVILNLALAFGAAVIFAGSQIDYFALALSVLAFATLLRFKIDVMWIVLGGGAAGLLKFLLFG